MAPGFELQPHSITHTAIIIHTASFHFAHRTDHGSVAGVIGTFLNAAAVILGGVIGLTLRKQPSVANQSAIKILLGVFTVYVGLSAVWQGLNGTVWQVLKQLGVALLALMLGNLTGKLLRIQKAMNRAGQYARKRMSGNPSEQPGFNDGFVVCSLLFCAAPLAIYGSLLDGITGNFKPLLIKAVMDGLATMAFVVMFGWSAMLSVIPLLAWQGTLTLLAGAVAPFLVRHGLVDSVNVTAGLLVFTVSLIILELKKVELADYLPSLVYAPLLTWLLLR